MKGCVKFPENQSLDNYGEDNLKNKLKQYFLDTYGVADELPQVDPDSRDITIQKLQNSNLVSIYFKNICFTKLGYTKLEASASKSDSTSPPQESNSAPLQTKAQSK